MAKPKYQPGDAVEVQCTTGVSWQPAKIVGNAAVEGGFIGRLWWVVEVSASRERHTIPQRRIRAGGGQVTERKPSYSQEVMLRVSWSVLNHQDGQPQHVRRGEVFLDLGLEDAPDPPLTADEMQRVAFAAKIAALKALRMRPRPQRDKKGGQSG